MPVLKTITKSLGYICRTNSRTLLASIIAPNSVKKDPRLIFEEHL